MESRAGMKTKLLKEIKEGFDFAMQDAIDKGLIKVIINDNGERIVKIIASEEEIKQAYLNDDDLTDEQKGKIKNDDTNESN